MKFDTPDPATSRHHLGVLAQTARAGTNGLAPPQRAILEALQKIPYQMDDASDIEQCITWSSVKEHTRSTDEALQLVRMMLVVSLADGPPSPAHFHDHCVDAGIAFPGEKGGFPEGAVYHDFTHVLSGYDTSPEGEMKAAAFQAGYTQGNWDFFTLLFGLVIHTAGVNLAPFPMPKLPGRIGQRNLAIEVLEALGRGAVINRDLGDGWNFWDLVDEPIENVRESLGIEPVDPSLLAA